MQKIYARDKRESTLESIYKFLCNNKKIFNWSCGYIVAIFMSVIDKISNLKNTEILDKLGSIFNEENKLRNIVTYIAIFFIVAYVVLIKILKYCFKNKTVESRLRDIYDKYTDPIFKGHETEGISWGVGQTVMSCPNIQNGWDTEVINFNIDNSLYNLNSLKNYDETLRDRNLDEEYKKFLKEDFSKQFTTDSDRLMLTKKPVATTDDNALLICLKKVKWSQLQFFWQKIITQDIKKKYIDDIFESDDGLIKHPNSFCLHLIIMTSDDKILLTEINSNKTNDYAKTWAVSIGEQIDKDDIKNLDEDCAYHWVKRALHEELSIKKDEFDKESIHFLSINLEGDIVNLAFACLVKLQIDSQTLQNKLSIEQRVDNEFKHIEFIELKDIPKELINETKKYHPSSKIRMIDTYLHLKGTSQLRLELLKEAMKKSK